MYKTDFIKAPVLKKKYYLFLDVDGVLNYNSIRKIKSKDHLYSHGEFGNKCGSGVVGMFKSAVKILNMLVRKLSRDYDVILVVSSSWRYHMYDFIRTIYRCGFKYTGDIFSTSKEQNERGLQIVNFLSNKDIDALLDDRFVVIDDEVDFDITPHVSPRNTIKTDSNRKGLTKKLVRMYLKHMKK